MVGQGSINIDLEQLFIQCGAHWLNTNFICLSDIRGKILFVNDSLLNSLGLKSEDVINNNINYFYLPQDDRAFFDKVLYQLSLNNVWNTECSCRFKQGKTHWLHSYFFLIHNAEQNEDLIAILSYDITEPKQIELNESRYNRVIQEQYRLMNEDLELAANTQKVFMMPSFIQTRNFDIYTYMKPLIHVTGDILSHKINLDGSVDVILADVAGHGLSSAYFTSSLVFIFQNLTHENSSKPANILNSIYNKIRYIAEDLFICATILRLNTDNTIEYSYAGNFPMLIKTKGKWNLLDGRGTPLSNGLDLSFTNYKKNIEPGDEILLFSDGCYELSNENEKILGYDGFYEYLKNHYSLDEAIPAQTIMRNLFALSNNKFHDDVSFAVIQKV
jgi:PAS domain S-box-containing protein